MSGTADGNIGGSRGTAYLVEASAIVALANSKGEKGRLKAILNRKLAFYFQHNATIRGLKQDPAGNYYGKEQAKCSPSSCMC